MQNGSALAHQYLGGLGLTLQKFVRCYHRVRPDDAVLNNEWSTNAVGTGLRAPGVDRLLQPQPGLLRAPKHSLIEKFQCKALVGELVATQVLPTGFIPLVGERKSNLIMASIDMRPSGPVRLVAPANAKRGLAATVRRVLGVGYQPN